MLITQRRITHISKLNRSFAAAVHEYITRDWMEFGRRDDLDQLLHVGRFDINNVCGVAIDAASR